MRIACVVLIVLIIISSFVYFKCSESFKNHFFVVIICRINNEHLMMDSFVPYYLKQGVDRIYLIDDNSTKPYSKIVMQNPKVEFIKGHLARETGNEMADADAVYKRIKNQTKWVISIDADEFIYSKKHNTIKDALQTTFKDADCVFVPWIMFSFNNLENDANNVLDDYVYRWNHDKKHPHPNNDKKNRCRYNAIESKAIFKTNAFMSLKSCHSPTEPTNKQLVYKESVYNTNQKSIFYKDLREKDIKNGIMFCNHYRFTSLNKIKQKCSKQSFTNYKNDDCVKNCVLSDHPEVFDDYLKNKNRSSMSV